MLSNKLTFSLVFVLMLAFAFVVTPAIAQHIQVDLADGTTNDQFVVLQRTTNNGIGTIAPAVLTLATTTPDLEDLLSFGGTIEVLLSVDAADSPAGDLTAAEVDTQAERDKLVRSVVITEIMWGLNLTPVTADDEDEAQWIELYLDDTAQLAADPADGAVSLLISPNERQDRLGTLLTAEAVTGTANTAVQYLVVDSAGTIDRFGVRWAPKGSGGNTDRLDDGTAPTNLASMYRKRDLDGAGATAKYKADKSFGDGTAAGQWEASANRKNMTGRFIGSPGSVHIPRVGAIADIARASIADNGIIINEVRNDTSAANVDWIELHNKNAPGTDPVSVNNWRIRLTTPTLTDGAVDASKNHTDSELAKLPDYRIPAGGFLLIVNRDPAETVLAGGVNLNQVFSEDDRQAVNKGATHAYYIDERLKFPNSGKFLITVRSGDKTNAHEQFVDFAGNGFFPNTARGTDVYPIRGFAKPGDVVEADFGGANTFASAGMAFARNTDKGKAKFRAGNRVHKDDWAPVGAKGGLGYDRGVDLATSPGTPGYANDAVHNLLINDQGNTVSTDDVMFDGRVTISEVMYDAGIRWNLVQWIELYNSSSTMAVDLKDWELEIRNVTADVQSFVDAKFTFNAGTIILPNQTLLLVSGTAANDVADNRVYDLYENHRRDLGLIGAVRNRHLLLSPEGFYLKLTPRTRDDQDGLERFTDDMSQIDEVGNIQVAVDPLPGAVNILRGAPRIPQWDLPERNEDGKRRSIVRQYGTRGIDGTPDDANDGLMAESWNVSDLDGAGLSYYGHRDDVGTPGWRLGGPLPVSLSSFRPVRDKATGEVVITWVTESELDNAGFNILRADSKDGAFEVVNVKGIIAGHGTTSEKHVYTFTDTTAKPNVVYYYQIEDVSLDGNRTTLATTHLRGNVNAAGKVTTTWGDLKTQ